MRSNEISRLRNLVEDRLLPDIFGHPVWIDFLESGNRLSTSQIERFMEIQRQLEADGDLYTACQLLFLCTAQHLLQGETGSAIACLEIILNFAKRQRLHQVDIWTTWAKSAIHMQRRDFRSAAYYLGELEGKLSLDDDWVLRTAIGQVEELLQEACQSSEPETEDRLRRHPALQWLECWGQLPHGLTSEQPERPPVTACASEAPSLEQNRKVRSRVELLFARIQACLRRVLDRGKRLETAELDEQTVRVWQDQPTALARPDVKASKPRLALSIGLAQAQFKADPADFHSIDGYLLGSFLAYQDEAPIRSWPGRKSKSIFKYLLIHHRRPVHREILMELLWETTDPKSARKNLHQAIYCLRQTLGREVGSFSHILLEDECYCLNPLLKIWLDSENFAENCASGKRLDRQNQLALAIDEYEKAETLYQGDFLAEDPYEDWCIAHREHLKLEYLHVLERLSILYYSRKHFAQAIQYCRKLLHEDLCREDAHRRLMRCMYFQGQRHLALSQFQICADALKQELGLAPMESTIRLHDEIKAGLVQFPGF